MDHSQHSLFEPDTALEEMTFDSGQGPLPHRLRPTEFKEFLGHEALFKKYHYLNTTQFPSLILFGPSGTGKTTLARLLAKNSQKHFFTFNAVLGGVQDLKKIIAQSIELKNQSQKESLIFIDEIHRFNKAQQDALLPYIEEGAFTFIGATTENPRVSVNKALLSRVQIIELKKLTPLTLKDILLQSLTKIEKTLDEKIVHIIADFSDGDARIALNNLETVLELKQPTPEEVKELIIENARAFDRGGNRHYDVISAFIKSMRGSDPQAAILWLAVMLDGGEDPVFIARRLVIFASEDVGNADPTALGLAMNALNAVSQIGMPEARIILAQATTYLASTFKSNASYLAINEALAFVSEQSTIEVPDHLKNFPPPYATAYQYPHNFPGSFIKQIYSPFSNLNFYRPTSHGKEDGIKKRLDSLK